MRFNHQNLGLIERISSPYVYGFENIGEYLRFRDKIKFTPKGFSFGEKRKSVGVAFLLFSSRINYNYLDGEPPNVSDLSGNFDVAIGSAHSETGHRIGMSQEDLTYLTQKNSHTFGKMTCALGRGDNLPFIIGYEEYNSVRMNKPFQR